MSESIPSSQDPLTTATQLVKNGRLEQAKEVLSRYLMQSPSSEQGWLLMSFVLSDAAQQKDCLERVLRINPNNTVAQSRLAHLLGKRTEELFQGKGKPPSLPVPKEKIAVERSPIPQPAPEPPSTGADKGRSQPVEPLFPPVMDSVPAAAAGRRSALSGKGFFITMVFLIVIVLGIIGTILFIGVIGPAISHLSMTSTPTPQAVIVPTLPPAWTITPTKSKTPKKL
jgi:hypothetical protein